MFISYAQNCEDIVLWRALGHVEHGTYVDVGAADPTEYSVTKAFYDRGWSGVNVEPAPEFAAALAEQRDRDINVAMCAGDVEGPITLHYVPGTGLSTVADDHLDTIADQKFEIVDIETEVKRLDAILADAGLAGRDIHFLKIDVEGAEESVLRSVDLSTWRPWIVVVEATEPTTTIQNHHRWEPILLDAGYLFCLFDGLNRFYLAEEHAELASRLSYPAGTFDQPYTVGAGENELAARTEALIVERDALAASYKRLEEHYRNALDGNEALEREHHNALRSFAELESRHLNAVAGYEALHTEHAAALNSYQELRDEHLKTVEGYERMEALYHDALSAYGRLHDEYDGALASYERLQSHCDSLTHACETARAELDVSASRVRELETTLLATRTELAESRAQLAAMAASASWRVTKPLRAIRRLGSR